MIKTNTNSEPANGSITWEIIKTIGIIILFFLFFRFYVFQPFSIKGSSMEPTFHDGEYMVVNEFTYLFSNPKRGDVVIFKHPEPACNDFIRGNYFNRVFLQGPCTNYIKRVVGLPGEEVTIKDGQVIVKNTENPNGFVLDENYIPEDFRTLGSQTRKLGKDEYYVLGDNRLPNASSDSREWGPLPREHIVGKGLIVLIPINEFGLIKRPDYKND